MPKTNLLDIVDVLETYADLYDMFDDNRLVYEALDKVNEELRAIPYVDAIPIEWIEKQIEQYYEDGYNSYGKALNIMLTDWKAENGRNK